MVLCPLTKNELLDVLELRNHPRIREYMLNSTEISLKSHLNWFSQYEADNMKETFLLKESGRVIGVVNFNFLTNDRKVVDWGFYVSPYSKKGNGTLLLTLALEKLFEEYEVNKVFAQVIDFNEKSIAIHKKLGFIREGILRQHYQREERFYDIHEFGLLRKEYLLTNKL